MEYQIQGPFEIQDKGDIKGWIMDGREGYKLLVKLNKNMRKKQLKINLNIHLKQH